MSVPSPKLNRIIDLKDVVYSTQQIFKYTEKIRNAYEHLIDRYELLSKENEQLKSESNKAPAGLFTPIDTGHKRRKTDESIINDSNDVLNEAIQDLSSCVEDEIIESTPKPDVSRKNVTKKIKTPNKRNQIKVENFDDSKDEAMPDVPRTIELNKKPESPLRSLENQSNAGKENRQKPKWIQNPFLSPNRISRNGFISTKSPKSRLSLARQPKQCAVEMATKVNKETVMDTCAETFFNGTPPNQVGLVKKKFLRQECLEASFNKSKDSDDENVFRFKSNSNVKPNSTSTTSPPYIKLEPQTGPASVSSTSNVKSNSISPPSIKLEPQTGQVKTSDVGNNVVIENNSMSSGSSVVALSGIKSEIIEILESQPLFDECSETFCEKLELNLKAVENENIVANHNISCRQCKMFMESSPHLTMEQKLDMIDRCRARYAIRPDTDPEFWNPRFVDTPESQKQETLIDDRWSKRKNKP